MKNLLIAIILQFGLFTPFFIIWLNDCKTIGKNKLAVSLGKRFFYWCLFFPFWAIVL